MNHIPVPVPQNLELDMMRMHYEFFDIYGIIPKRSQSLGLSRQKRLLDLFGPSCQPHPLSTTTGRSLQHHRISDTIADVYGLLRRIQVLSSTGYNRHTRLPHSPTRRNLIPHNLHSLGLRTDENDAGPPAPSGKIRILRQEAVSGMNRIRPVFESHLNNSVDIQITLPGLSRTDTIRLICIHHMPGRPVGLGEYGDGPYLHLLARPHHSDSDLAAIGYQYLLYHCFLLIMSL